MFRAALAILASLLLGTVMPRQTPGEPGGWRHAAGDRAEGSQPAAWRILLVHQPPPATGVGTIVLQHHFSELIATRQALTIETINADGRTFDRWRIAR